MTITQIERLEKLAKAEATRKEKARAVSKAWRLANPGAAKRYQAARKQELADLRAELAAERASHDA